MLRVAIRVLAERDGVQVLLGGPAAQPAAPFVLEDEVLDQFAVVTGQVVLGDQQHLEGFRHFLGQRDLRRIPVVATQEGEVPALVNGT